MNNTNSIKMYCYMEPISSIVFYLDCVLLVPIIALNLLTIVCCIRYYQLRTYTNVFVASLASSDLLFGLLALAPGIWMKTQDNYHEKIGCLYIMAAGLGSFFLSLSNLMMISVERYIAVCRPYQYILWVTDRTTAVSVASCWSVNLLFMVIFLSFNTWSDELPCTSAEMFPSSLMTTVVGLVLVLLALTVLCYFNVITVVIKQFRTVNSVGIPTMVGKAEIKKSIMMMIVFGLFLAFLLPIPILRVAELNLPFDRKLSTAKCILITLVKANCFINSLVYNTCNKLFRKATLHLLSCSRQPLHVSD